MSTHVTRSALLFLVLLLSLGGCGDDSPGEPDTGPPPGDAGMDAAEDAEPPPPPPFEPTGYCPGPGCDDPGDGVLMVGVAMRDVTPVIDETTDVLTVDTNGDAEWNPFDGDEFADNNGNGKFDGVWIAGFGNPRPAAGVNDPQWVRALALRVGDTTVVLGAIDCVGYFFDEVQHVRERVADLGIDYLMLAGTHSHQARDTEGIWGLDETSTGVDEAHMEMILDRAEEAVREAVADLRPANVQYATFDLRSKPGGVLRYVSDVRDPNVIDDQVRVLRFTDAGADTTIGTLVNFGAHPEYFGSDNDLLSSDFAHYLRLGVEEGIAGPDGAVAEGVGGMALYLNGAVGSQIGPGRVRPQTWAGEDLPSHSPLSGQTVGEQLAWFVLQALADGGGSETDETASLSFRRKEFFVDIENRAFHVALLGKLFIRRQSYNWDASLLLRPGTNEPDILTEVGVLDIGRASLLMVPGELDPVLWLGGYDGSYTPDGQVLVDDTQTDPPDLSMAPPAPYLRDLLRADADYKFIIGLAADHIGYFVPDFDYKLDRRNPYIDEAPGDHYEETVSVGINGWGRVRSQMEALLAWTPDSGG